MCPALDGVRLRKGHRHGNVQHQVEGARRLQRR
jgi:hypothetical protein